MEKSDDMRFAANAVGYETGKLLLRFHSQCNDEGSCILIWKFARRPHLSLARGRSLIRGVDCKVEFQVFPTSLDLAKPCERGPLALRCGCGINRVGNSCPFVVELDSYGLGRA